MRRMVRIESAAEGLLYVNGQFCGPMEKEGQAFPAGRNAEIFVQLYPFGSEQAPLAVRMELRGGKVTRLEPQDCAFALLWPDGIVQLELRPASAAAAQEQEEAAHGLLLRYLALCLAGDERAQTMSIRPLRLNLSGYCAAVPLAFAPHDAHGQYDDRAGLVARLAPNVARVDAALAATVPAGQGHRLIERIEIRETGGRPSSESGQIAENSASARRNME